MDACAKSRRQAADAPGLTSPLVNSPERFFNRELSWLKFNTRVLEEAENRRHPLLERLRFLSISAIQPRRVLLGPRRRPSPAGAHRHHARLVRRPDADSSSLQRIGAEAGQLMAEQQRIWTDIRAEMKRAGLAVVDADDLTEADTEWLRARFMERVFPVLTPLAIDPSHPFPFLPNQGFAVGFSL